jgi:hypothetical protein
VTRPDGAQEDPGAVGLVDWGRTGRRVRASVLLLAGAVLLGWVVLSVLGGGFDPGTLGELVGLAFGVLFVIELVVVGGAALRGMLRAGERGERLSSDGVGLFPPRMPSAEERGLRGDEAQ